MNKSDFNVRIIPGLSPSDVKIEAEGQYQNLLTADILKGGWGIDDLGKDMADWLTKHGYRDVSVDEVIWDVSDLSDPVGAIDPNGYVQTNAAPRVAGRVDIKVLESKIHKMTSRVVLADYAEWDNSGSEGPSHFSATLSFSLSDSVSIGWEKSDTLGISAEVGVEVGGVGAKTTASASTTWGESTDRTTGKEVAVSHEVSADLDGGERRIAASVLNQIDLLVDVRFRVTLASPTPIVGFKGHILGKRAHQPQQGDFIESASSWMYWLEDLLHHAGKPATAEITARIPASATASSQQKVVTVPGFTAADIDAATGRGQTKVLLDVDSEEL